MNIKDEKVCNIIANISALLIPISLASISLTGAIATEGVSKNIMMITIPVQIGLLIFALWIAIGLYHKTDTEAKTHLKYCKGSFFIALILIAVNHLIPLLSS